MNQKTSVKKAIAQPDWLKPISKEEPCGPNLEYDTEYAVLTAKLLPKGEAQYGDFIGSTEAPQWQEIERDCQRMLLRTKDITILGYLLRSMTRARAAEGLRDGLTQLVTLLETYPKDIHPQLMVDGEEDYEMRANALLTLVDPEGLLADIRDIFLAKNSLMRLKMRDVERAFAIPRPADALAPESVLQQLRDLMRKQDASLRALQDSGALINRLIDWTKQHLKDEAPDLTVLRKMFEKLLTLDHERADDVETPIGSNDIEQNIASIHTDAEQAIEHSEEDTRTTPEELPTTVTAYASPPIVKTRQHVKHDIGASRKWFETHEPSSPISALLLLAEQLVGKSYLEVTQLIPAEVLQQLLSLSAEQHIDNDNSC